MLRGKRRRDRVAPVAALGRVAHVAEACHQLCPDVTDPFDTPSDFAGLAGKSVPGDRRCDHVERLVNRSAVPGGVGERLDRLLELEDRPGPAVRDDDRQRVGVRRTLVDEVNIDAGDVGDVLVESVERRFTLSPVVLVRPVAAHVLQVGERYALGPVGDHLRVGPARLSEPGAQVVENVIGHVDGEGSDLVTHGRRNGRAFRGRVLAGSS